MHAKVLYYELLYVLGATLFGTLRSVYVCLVVRSSMDLFATYTVQHIGPMHIATTA